MATARFTSITADTCKQNIIQRRNWRPVCFLRGLRTATGILWYGLLLVGRMGSPEIDNASRGQLALETSLFPIR